MCTVSFFKDKNKTIITSNRDENINRSVALKPLKKNLNIGWAYYPTDPQSNGTWFGVKHNGDIFVLLNGAAKKHVYKPPYSKSRGLILIEIIKSENFQETWRNISLKNIEPFTIICYVDNQLIKIQWNELEKSLLKLDTEIAHIWSSSTLYTSEIIEKRKIWFSEFLDQKNNIDANDILNFHSNTQIDDLENGLIIKRKNLILTKNITQCVIENNSILLTHFDLINHEKHEISDYLC